MKRKFFDWNRPFLPAVAKLIVEEAIQRPDAGPSVDLSRYVYVLSGNRALRTFEAYVQYEINAAVKSGRIAPGWTPPEYVALGAAPGLALNYGTPVEKALPYAQDADILLVMGVPAGFGGQKFRPDSLDAVRALRKAARGDALLELDGGTSVETVASIVEAGVNFAVAGSAFFHAKDYAAQMHALKGAALAALSSKRWALRGWSAEN